MLFTKEAVRDNIRNREGKRVFFLDSKDTLTPGARDWLTRERIAVLPAEMAKPDGYRLLCGAVVSEKPEQMTQDQTLVVGTLNFDGKFSPFFYTNAYENDVLGLVNTTLLGTDREGSVVLRGVSSQARKVRETACVGRMMPIE